MKFLCTIKEILLIFVNIYTDRTSMDNLTEYKFNAIKYTNVYIILSECIVMCCIVYKVRTMARLTVVDLNILSVSIPNIKIFSTAKTNNLKNSRNSFQVGRFSLNKNMFLFIFKYLSNLPNTYQYLHYCQILIRKCFKIITLAELFRVIFFFNQKHITTTYLILIFQNFNAMIFL